MNLPFVVAQVGIDLSSINVEKLSLIALLLAIVGGALKGYWVPGWIYTQKVEECKTQTAVASQAVTLSERLTKDWVPRDDHFDFQKDRERAG